MALLEKTILIWFAILIVSSICGLIAELANKKRLADTLMVFILGIGLLGLAGFIICVALTPGAGLR